MPKDSSGIGMGMIHSRAENINGRGMGIFYKLESDFYIQGAFTQTVKQSDYSIYSIGIATRNTDLIPVYFSTGFVKVGENRSISWTGESVFFYSLASNKAAIVPFIGFGASVGSVRTRGVNGWYTKDIKKENSEFYVSSGINISAALTPFNLLSFGYTFSRTVSSEISTHVLGIGLAIIM